jgi:dipeptidyl aminopeptidase/acylaminoacyl peptidase
MPAKDQNETYLIPKTHDLSPARDHLNAARRRPACLSAAGTEVKVNRFLYEMWLKKVGKRCTILLVGWLIVGLVGCAPNLQGEYIILETFKGPRLVAPESMSLSDLNLPAAGRVSPDGEKVAMATGGSTGSSFVRDVVIYDLKTGSQKVLASKIMTAETPDWSPTGEAVVFIAGVGTQDPAPFNLYQAKTDGTDVHTVVNCRDVGCRNARWSPDGKKIAFASWNGLEMVDADGSNRAVLVDRSYGPITWLDWSPDGTQITAVVAGKITVLIATVSDKSVRQIDTRAEGRYDSVLWSPAGDRLALTGSIKQSAMMRDYVLSIVDLQGNELKRMSLNEVGGGRALDWKQ